MDPVVFFKSLADETRLRCVLLIERERELCVCELTEALQESQPKISRHLALLREKGMLLDRRQGQWNYYQINPELPSWAKTVISQSLEANSDFISSQLTNLNAMADRPNLCCAK